MAVLDSPLGVPNSQVPLYTSGIGIEIWKQHLRYLCDTHIYCITFCHQMSYKQNAITITYTAFLICLEDQREDLALINTVLQHTVPTTVTQKLTCMIY